VSATVFLAAGMIFAAFIVVHHLRFILRAPEVDTQVLCAVSTFLMLGLLWTFGYLLLDAVAPHSMTVNTGSGTGNRLTGFDALYISFATLSGLSFGEIVPASNVARMMALLESMIAMFYVAILISRLVALHTERTRATH
jgi:hypothetical protein